MANVFLKAQQVVAAGLGILERELTIPKLVWRDPVSSFVGAFGDTVSIRVPVYATARTRVLRSGTTRTRDSLAEAKIDVSLDTDVYKDVAITDEELTLDISNFGTQVLNPIMAAVARTIEDAVVTRISGATYPAQNTIVYDISNGNPYVNIAVAARRKLNDARVPFAGRALVVGSAIEAILLSDPMLVRVNESGSSDALREAQIGKLAGFDVYASPALDPDEGYAFHKSAFILSNAAPVVPAGAPWGASETFAGFAMRAVRVLDSTRIEDVLAVDSWIGTGLVTDHGSFVDGRFVPDEDPNDSGSTSVLARAVKITTQA